MITIKPFWFEFTAYVNRTTSFILLWWNHVQNRMLRLKVENLQYRWFYRDIYRILHGTTSCSSAEGERNSVS